MTKSLCLALIRPALRWCGRQEWIRFGFRNRLVRAFDNPDGAPDEEFVIDFFSYHYPGNMSSFIDWSVYYFGAYAREELRLMERILSRMDRPVVLDVGANVGHHSLYASTFASHVIAVEPFAELAKQISEKAKANSISTIRVLEMAFGDGDSDARFHPPSGANQGTGSLVADRGHTGTTMIVPVRRGDAVLQELGIERVDFVKVDVENFEALVLRGLRETLCSCRPIVFFEWSMERGAMLNGERPEALFPGRYSFYRFRAPRPLLGILNRPGFILENCVGDWSPPSGEINLLAVPVESVSLIAEM